MRYPSAAKAAIACFLLMFAGSGRAQELGDALKDDPDQQHRDLTYRQDPDSQHHVRRGRVDPHWLSDGNRFWYIDHLTSGRPVYLVSPKRRSRVQLFDLRDLETRIESLREEASGLDPPLQQIDIMGEDPDVIELVVENQRYKLNRRTGYLRLLPDEARSTSTASAADGIVFSDGHRAVRIDSLDVPFRSVEAAVKHRLSGGSYSVVEIVGVDEEAGWVYFTAQSDPGHPHDTHLCRTALEGGPVHQLTDGRGTHSVELSPDRTVFVDHFQNVDLLSVVELRRSDGTLLDTLSVAKIDAGNP